MRYSYQLSEQYLEVLVLCRRFGLHWTDRTSYTLPIFRRSRVLRNLRSERLHELHDMLENAGRLMVVIERSASCMANLLPPRLIERPEFYGRSMVEAYLLILD